MLYREICQTMSEQSIYSLTAGSPVRAATFGSYAAAVIALSVSVYMITGDAILIAFIALAALLALALVAMPCCTLKRYEDSLDSGNLNKLTRAREALAKWLMENGSQG